MDIEVISTVEFWIWSLLVLMLYSIILEFIGWLESLTKVPHLFRRQSRHLVGITGLIFIGLFGVLLAIYVFFPERYVTISMVVLVIVKIATSIFIAGAAGELGRNRILWFLLGLIEFHVVLLVLSLSKSYLNVLPAFKGPIRSLNKSFKLRRRAINQSVSNRIISKIEGLKKMDDLEKEYDKELVKLMNQLENRNYNEQLNNAFSAGVISQDELLAKRKKEDNES